ncbi:hypothetical protein CDAR_560471 [Caerostris darwini]|uniref:Uncharacterized protein n=1 Tax=Caerostris darwini TaxID=1538125 RepID=A0AAV4W115_9ARAC|nr:hypothetical protein CDAR_560211 [Caerostris darwini]GIY75691.1 hypothetical protein CDAR_560471 [Caerostris darwini]
MYDAPPTSISLITDAHNGDGICLIREAFKYIRVFSRTKGFQTFTNRVGGALVVGGDNRRSKYRRIEAEMKNAASRPYARSRLPNC